MNTLPDLADRIRHAGELAVQVEQVSPTTMTATSSFIQMPTDAEMLLALAEAERPCPCMAKPQCATCDSVGFHSARCGQPCRYPYARVPLFPTLREPCRLWYAERGYHVHLSAFGTGVCDNCHLHRSQSKEECEASCHCAGRGWVPIEEERVAEAILPFVGMEKAVALVAKAYELLYASKVATWTQGFLAALVLTTAEEKP